MTLPIHLSKDSREPIYHQIEKQIKALIAGELLQAGSPLPSIRVLSKDLEVSVITTRRAYQNLESKGFIRTVQGRGTFVADVDQSLKEQVKDSHVNQAMEKAIETAFRYEYSKEQVKNIFMNMLAEYDAKHKEEK